MLANRCLRCLKPFSLRGQELGGVDSLTRILTCSYWRESRGDEYAGRKKIKRPLKTELKEGFQEMGGEFSKWTHEVKEKFTSDPIFMLDHGDYEILHKFNTPESIDQWVVTSDSDMGEGKSQAEFLLGPNKTGLFRGFVNTETPKDGIIKNAGYCHVKSPTKMKSFKRTTPYDLSLFNHLLLRVRGDGRPYQIMISMDRYYDVQWLDQYSYAMFTRGGPYWQFAKIPFSKFFLTSMGRIQDCQEPIQLAEVTSFGITLADGCTGPFQLEIDFLGVIRDERHVEAFAYEMYEVKGACLY